MTSYQVRVTDGHAYTDIDIEAENHELACDKAMEIADGEDGWELDWEPFENDGGDHYIDRVLSDVKNSRDQHDVPQHYKSWYIQRITSLESKIEQLTQIITDNLGK